jgi:hypothetical protein
MSFFKKNKKKDEPSNDMSVLLGVAIDVSGSMKSSIRNSQALDISRLGGVEKSMDTLLNKSRELAQQHGQDVKFPLDVFAYAFGLKVDPGYVDILSLLELAKDKDFKDHLINCGMDKINDHMEKLQLKGLVGLARSFGFGNYVDSYAQKAGIEEVLKSRIVDKTLSVGELAEMWASSGGSFDEAHQLIFGGTPMRRCLEEIERRFQREQRTEKAGTRERILLIISDGEPTDGNPSEIVKRMKAEGIIVACAYVTDSNVQAPRELRNAIDPTWKHEAQLMFDMASSIEPLENTLNDAGYKTLQKDLIKSGWSAPDGAKLFIQINHSDVLADFMRIIATAIPARKLLKYVL